MNYYLRWDGEPPASPSPLRGITKGFGFGDILAKGMREGEPLTRESAMRVAEATRKWRKPKKVTVMGRLISQLYYRVGYWVTYAPSDKAMRWSNALMIRGLHVQVGKRRF